MIHTNMQYTVYTTLHIHTLAIAYHSIRVEITSWCIDRPRICISIVMFVYVYVFVDVFTPMYPSAYVCVPRHTTRTGNIYLFIYRRRIWRSRLFIWMNTQYWSCNMRGAHMYKCWWINKLTDWEQQRTSESVDTSTHQRQSVDSRWCCLTCAVFGFWNLECVSVLKCAGGHLAISTFCYYSQI